MEDYETIFYFMRADAGLDKSVFEKHVNTKGKTSYICKCDLSDICQYQNGNLVVDWELALNTFWMPNRGKEDYIMGKCQEVRKQEDIIGFNFFYFDFDLKKDDNTHYTGDELIKEKEQLLDKIKQLPLEPNYIVESRNGYHVYYTILPKTSRRLNAPIWKFIERSMYNYIYENISNCVDANATNVNRLLRLPISLHQKPGDEDEFLVKPISMYKYEEACKLVHKREYVKRMFSRSIKEFIDAFHIVLPNKNASNKDVPHSSTNAPYRVSNENASNLSSQQIKSDTEARRTYKSVCKNNLPSLFNLDEFKKDVKTSSYNNNTLVASIHKQFNTELERLSALVENKIFNTRQEATGFIKKIDLRSILNIGTELNAKVHSLFYTDNDPSDWFFKNTNNEIVYFCSRDRFTYNNIFQITARVQYTDSFPNLSKEEWKEVYDFVYSMFGISIHTSWKVAFATTRNKNIEAFDNLIKHSKQTKWMKAYKEVYQVLMDLWKEHVEEHRMDWQKCKRDLAQKWLSSEIEKRTGKKKSKEDIRRCLLVFRYVGILKQVESGYSPDKMLLGTSKGMVESVNRYQFLPIYSSSIFNEIISKCEFIRLHLDKPSKEISEKKLEEMFIDYYIDKLNK